MAKKSKKRAVRFEKERSGCMWGLISIFDFRRHSTRKLMGDKKNTSRLTSGIGKLSNQFAMLTDLDEGCLDSNDLEKIKKADEEKHSVQKLMEKEMLREQKVKKGKSDLEIGLKTTKKATKKSSDMDSHHLSNTSDLKIDSFSHKCSELECIDDLYLDKIVEEFCMEISQKVTLNLKHDEDDKSDMNKEYYSNFEDKLSDSVREFMDQNIANWKDFTEGHKIEQLKEIARMLQVSSFDDELLIKLLHDRNSFLVKHVQNSIVNDSENSEKSKLVLDKVEKSDQLVGDKKHKFFRRKVKKSENIEASTRIVILKPGTSIGSYDLDKSLRESSKSSSAIQKVNTHFLLDELKRKTKHALGKERLEISTNNVSSNRTFSEEPMEKITRSSNGGKRGDQNGKFISSVTRTVHEHGDSKRELSNVYIEDRKHLSDNLSSGADGVEFLTRHRQKTLGRILSLPEYNYSPIESPRKDLQQGFVNGDMRYSINGKYLNLNDGEVNVAKHYQEHEGNEEIVKTISTAICELKNESDVSLLRSDSYLAIKDQHGDIFDTCDDKKNSESLELKLPEEHEILSPLSSPSSSVLIRKSIEDIERTRDIQDPLSPVSILEPLLSEEDTSPMDATEKPAMLVMQPLQIQFEELDNSRVNKSKTILVDKNLIFGYVRKVLLTSGKNPNDFLVKWLSSEQLIDRRLINYQLCYDQHLLFDCINEVLGDLCQSYCPWFVSLTRTCIRKVHDFEAYINEVCKGVYWHIVLPPLPRALDQLVEKDMERTPNWIELQFDHGIVMIEMAELIFKDTVDEVIFSYAMDLELTYRNEF